MKPIDLAHIDPDAEKHEAGEVESLGDDHEDEVDAGQSHCGETEPVARSDIATGDVLTDKGERWPFVGSKLEDIFLDVG